MSGTKKYLNLPYPVNLISTVCESDQITVLTQDQLIGLQHALQSMTPREQEVIQQRFVEQKTFSQIGTLYNISQDKIYSIYKRCLRKLKRPERFELITLGYQKAQEVNAEKASALKAADKKAFREAVEQINKPELLKMSIKELHLSVRVENRLFESQICTLESLWIIMNRHPEQFVEIRGLGEKGQAEIREKLSTLGL
ncbi:MAG: sigma-70 family RNA polymerase sigma factor [Lachnospiraceae bacterium]|nr:sigma-70 family RNA polymerase sigma factor [Lachnospiraceae bacterium]